MASFSHPMCKHVGKGVGRITDLVMVRGAGTYLHTACGRTLLDFTSGIGVTNTGHCHPRVMEAAKAQIDKLVHGQVNLGFHQPMLELIEELLPLLPGSLDTLIFPTTGAEAVENAVKLARYSTGRPNVICFNGSYHGRTQGTMAMTSSAVNYRQHFGPFPPGIHFSPFPYELHGKTTEACLSDLRLMLKQQTLPEEVAAVVLEPVLGEGGYVPSPPAFIKGVRDICTEFGILFVLDEIQTGFGRTGKLFCSEHYPDAPPDILVMAKGLASGFPLSAIASRRDITDTQDPGTMGGTYAGNAVACAAALETQRVIRDELLVENAATQGARLTAMLNDVATRHPAIRDVRGLGAMIGVELAADLPAGTDKKVVNACLDRDMMLLSCSVFNTLRFIPPLTVAPEARHVLLYF